MQGFEYVTIQEKYETVAAYSVSAQAEGGSGDTGYYEQGYVIEWTTVGAGGITDSGWYTDNPNSPFYGKTEDEIVAYAEKNGNLNAYFRAWGDNQSIDRNQFIKNTISSSCWSIL